MKKVKEGTKPYIKTTKMTAEVVTTAKAVRHTFRELNFDNAVLELHDLKGELSILKKRDTVLRDYVRANIREQKLLQYNEQKNPFVMVGKIKCTLAIDKPKEVLQTEPEQTIKILEAIGIPKAEFSKKVVTTSIFIDEPKIKQLIADGKISANIKAELFKTVEGNERVVLG